jgi:ABC-type uncharacterized transport system substrate-binding protein
VAGHADRILKGARAAELPAKFELVVNLKTAKTLGITTSSGVLRKAVQSALKKFLRSSSLVGWM